MGRTRSTKAIVQTLLIIGILIVINLISSKFYSYLDLTEDKRFTLENSTTKLLSDIDDVIFVEVLLEGTMTSGMKSLKERTTEILLEFNSINSLIEFKYIDPSKGSPEQVNTIRKNLSMDGIYPQKLEIQEEDQRVVKLIYPYAIVKYGPRKVAVNLLEPINRGESEEEAISKSMAMLEYKLANAVQKTYISKSPIIAFTQGHGELDDSETATLESELGQVMEVRKLNLDTSIQINSEINVLIVADPKTKISEKNQFKIDQYIMNGGKVVWLIDQFYVNIDSLNTNKLYVPRKKESGVESLLFKYGIRIKGDLVLDLENTKIPQVVGRQGGKEQVQEFDWVYHPLLQANLESPIVKSIDRVSSTFPSSIDILDGHPNIKATPLLTSSEYSRTQVYPMRLSFEILKLENKTEAYKKSNLPVAVLLEGEFQSFFKNRLTEKMSEGLEQLNIAFKESSAQTAQVIITDPDIIRNEYNPKTNQISPIGYNRWNDQIYKGNRDFIINVIDYLVDDYGLMEARSKSLKLRLLNQVELQDNKLKWQVINLVLPILVVFLFGLFFNWRRKQKYS